VCVKALSPVRSTSTLGRRLPTVIPTQTGINRSILRTLQYRDSSAWKHVNVGERSSADSSLRAELVHPFEHEDLTLDSNSQQSINAIVVAAAVGIGGGSSTGVGVSAAGSYAESKIKTDVKAYIDGDGACDRNRR
jgi:hypothetical protein